MKIEINRTPNNYLQLKIKNTDNNKISYLPRGSGINSDYNIIEKENKFIISNVYHYMNEHGFYDGYLPFSIHLNKNNVNDFKLLFNGLNSNGYYRVNKSMLRDYLEDLFAEIFYELGD